MGTKLIELDDGTLVEVDIQNNQPQEISSRSAKAVNASINHIKPILVNVCRPIAAAWKEIAQEDMDIEQAEVEIGFSFEGEGNIYVTKIKANSNLKVKLVLKRKA